MAMSKTVLTETKSVRKWGNGLGVLIPAKVASTLDLTAGDNLVMHLTDQNTLVLEKKRKNVQCQPLTFVISLKNMIFS